MTRQLATPEPLYVRLGDAFVILSATLLSLASGAWLIGRFGFTLSSAILAALGTYCTLLVLHLLARRLMQAGETEDDMAGEDDVHWQSGAAAFDSALARHTGDAERFSLPDDVPTPRTQPGTWPEPLPMPLTDQPEASQAFKFRPSRIPYFEAGEQPEPERPGQPAGEARELEARLAPSEINVEVIQDLIKKLADELNSPSGSDTPADGGAGTESAAEPDGMIGRSVAALDTATRAMRGAQTGPGEALLAPAARGNVPDWWPTTSAVAEGGPPAVDPQLARIAEAIVAERFEVLIEPIQALAEGRPRHYEVSMRLVTADGGAIEQADYMRTAQASDLLPHIDAARMLRAARVARKLGERGRQGSVLSAMAGASITDNEFLDIAAQQTANDGHMRLVLSFSQSDARTFTPAHAEALGAMAASGFGFALEDVTDLEMDFGRLKAIGFEFIKLDAKVFLEGLQAPGGCVPASDICRYLSEFGLALIVGSIEDDWLLARIMGFGVLLGKGTLFGGPRLVKAEAVAGPGTAAA
jgi:EAL domain-containing protein (putative c-di-GMP-specific phosphodiesterase class I)